MPRRYCIRALVGEDGFEPSKRNATDLQSAPFGHSGTLPYEIGAGGRIRTPDLLITNQLLYQLSYTSIFNQHVLLYQKVLILSIQIYKIGGIYFGQPQAPAKPFLQAGKKIGRCFKMRHLF